jgi:hypothetical protein
MRLPVLTLLFVAALLFGENRAASAQSENSYRWCATYATKGGTPSCYFATREQCMETISGIGGSCSENPYHVAAVRPVHVPAARKHTSKNAHAAAR